MTRPADSFHVFDTTLRDGAQREGISYSVADKLAVARLLDEYGVGFIEGGWPGAMPKDTEFFARARTELDLQHAQLVAFGATRKAGVPVEEDKQVAGLLESEAPVVCLVAKSDVRHVKEALRTTNEENLDMVADTVAYFVEHGRRVFVDLEHFFDGYRHDPDYGVRLLQRAFEAGASVGVLCDTNGGMLPSDVFRIVTDVKERSGVRLGIHCQDDTGCAVANSIAAVEAGATHFQGTSNGYGERTGNADLFVTVANLELKRGMTLLPAGKLAETTRIAHAIADITNLPPNTHQPYAGISSFAHKAGLHASALKVNTELYNHIHPEVVGNTQRVLITEMAGRASVEMKGTELGYSLAQHPEVITRVVERVKALEQRGYSFEAADASFELMLADELGLVQRAYEVESWRTIVSEAKDGTVVSEAIVKLLVEGERIISAAEGNGPVNALDNALRRAVTQVHPELADLELVDYKVRILEGVKGTEAVTRVLVSTTDGQRQWTTVGVHSNVIHASWLALDDAITFGLLSKNGRPAAPDR